MGARLYIYHTAVVYKSLWDRFLGSGHIDRSINFVLFHLSFESFELFQYLMR